MQNITDSNAKSIKSIQKVIKVGSSLAVTIPAKDARFAGIEAGQEVQIDVKPLAAQTSTTIIAQEYDAFKAQYGDTLKNLAKR